MDRIWGNVPCISGKYVVWVHAVSVGETKAAVALCRLIKKERPDCHLVISSITITGHQEAKKSLPFADSHIYLPFDLTFLCRRLVNRLKPNLVLIVETDFWYQFLKECKTKGAKVVLVSGKMSATSASRWIKFPKIAEQLFSPIDLFCLQDTLEKERFLSIGIPQEKIQITGNMKFSGLKPPLSEERLAEVRKRIGIQKEDFVLLVASTHDPEEKLLLPIFEEIWKQNSQFKVLLAPRHPERFEAVAELLGEGAGRFSKKCTNKRCILIDAMGELDTLFQVSDLALVCGSYTDSVGGHNILEPCQWGVPVLFGPHMHSQQSLVKAVSSYGAGEEVSIADLQQSLSSMIENASQRKTMSLAGIHMTEELGKAPNRTLKAMKDY